MFKEALYNLEKKLLDCDVSTKSLIVKRLSKINEVYLYNLFVSKNIVESNGQKTVLRNLINGSKTNWFIRRII